MQDANKIIDNIDAAVENGVARAEANREPDRDGMIAFIREVADNPCANKLVIKARAMLARIDF